MHAARFGTLPVLDGFGWSASAQDRALGHWLVNGCELRITSTPEVLEACSDTDRLVLRFPVTGNDVLVVVFTPTQWNAKLVSGTPLQLSVRWMQTAATAFRGVYPNIEGNSELRFEHEKFSYALQISTGAALAKLNGFDLHSQQEDGILCIQTVVSPAAIGLAELVG